MAKEQEQEFETVESLKHIFHPEGEDDAED